MAYFIVNLTTGQDVVGPIDARSTATDFLDKIRASNPFMYVGIEARMRSR